VELISDQMIKGAPLPSDETVAAWRQALDASGLVPVCNDTFINSTIYKNRTLRVPEQVELLKRELDVTKKLGFDLTRLVSDTRADVTLAALPYAEKLGVTMACELHAGMSFDTPLTADWLNMMKQAQSEYLGVVVDLGIFCDRPPRVFTDYFKSIGLSHPVADKVNELYAKHGDLFRVYVGPYRGPGSRDYFPAELADLFTSPIDEEYAMLAGGYESTPFERLDEYAPYIRHVHAKFYEMLDDGTEYSINYPAVLTKFNQLGYDGYFSSEYEGQRFVPLGVEIEDQEPVRRHQAMLAAHINDGK
jgi:sugar phosphate isomerase/epimerase